MTAQVMPLNMADMSDEKLADFFFAKAFTDDEPEGEPPTIPKERWRLTPTELEFIRAAASPAERQQKGGRTMVDRWAGICDVGRMAELGGENLPYCNRLDLYSSAPRLQCEDAPRQPSSC